MLKLSRSDMIYLVCYYLRIFVCNFYMYLNTIIDITLDSITFAIMGTSPINKTSHTRVRLVLTSYGIGLLWAPTFTFVAGVNLDVGDLGHGVLEGADVDVHLVAHQAVEVVRDVLRVARVTPQALGDTECRVAV